MNDVATDDHLVVCLPVGAGVRREIDFEVRQFQIAPADIPRIGDVRLNITVLSFSAAITLLTALAFGLFPALAAFRINLNKTLNEGSGKLSGERSGKQFRDAMVVAEITLAMALLAGAMLVLRSFVNLSRVNLWFPSV